MVIISREAGSETKILEHRGFAIDFQVKSGGIGRGSTFFLSPDVKYQYSTVQ